MAMNITIPLSNYKSNGERVTPGRYQVVIDDLEMTETKGGNGKPQKPMLNVWFRITSGEFEDSVVKDRFVLQDNALFRIVMLMQALGMKTPKKDLRIPAERFLGKRLEIDVQDGEPFRGRVNSEVTDYIKLAAAPAAASADVDEDAEDDAEDTVAESAPATSSDDLDDLEDLEV